jgi:hypothetical protein
VDLKEQYTRLEADIEAWHAEENHTRDALKILEAHNAQMIGANQNSAQTDSELK